MIVPVRWCKYSIRGFLDIVNRKNYLEPPWFKGLGGPVMNELMEVLHRNLPFSVNRSGSNFDLLGSCLQAASSNNTDIPLEQFVYPQNVELDKVYPTQQISETTVVIIT